MVDCLKLASNSWNLDFLKENLLSDDVDMILSLPPASPSLDDSLLWHFDHNRSYSIYSGYQVGSMLAASPGLSGLDESVSWWKTLWRFKLPSKSNSICGGLATIGCRRWAILLGVECLLMVFVLGVTNSRNRCPKLFGDAVIWPRIEKIALFREASFI